MIQKIEIKLGEKTYEFTLEEVIELRKELNEMFGTSYPYHVIQPFFPSPLMPEPFKIWYSTTSGSDIYMAKHDMCGGNNVEQ